jgi:tetratricopeptide (TPR) repeat protein
LPDPREDQLRNDFEELRGLLLDLARGQDPQQRDQRLQDVSQKASTYLQSLSEHPEFPKLRASFEALMKPENSGTIGIALAFNVLSEAWHTGTPSHIRPDPEADWGGLVSIEPDNEGFGEFEAYLVAHKEHRRTNSAGNLVIFPESLPAEFRDHNLEKVLGHGTWFLENLYTALDGDEAGGAVGIAKALVDLAALHGNRIRVLRLFELLGCILCHLRQFQLARNCAETILALTSSTSPPVERFFAWLGYAAIYQACRMPREASSGLALAIYSLDSPPPTPAFSLMFELQVRILRDLQRYDSAQAVLEHGREAYPEVFIHPVFKNNLKLLSGQLEMRMITRPDTAGSNEKSIAHLKKATEIFLELGEAPDASPHHHQLAVLHSSQLKPIYRDFDLEVPEAIGELEERVRSVLPPEFQRRFERVASDTLCPPDLIDFVSKSQPSHVPTDFAEERGELDVYARKALDTALESKDHHGAVICLECQFDQTVGLPEWVREGTPQEADEALRSAGARWAAGDGAEIETDLGSLASGSARVGSPSHTASRSTLARFIDTELGPALQRPPLGTQNLALYGLTSTVDLVCIPIENGVIQPPIVQGIPGEFARNLGEWRSSLPYGFGDEAAFDRRSGSGVNDVMAAMASIQLPFPFAANTSVSIVPIPRMLSIPFNIMLNEGRFIGETHRVSVAPSLRWASANRWTEPARPGRVVVWSLEPSESEVSASPISHGLQSAVDEGLVGVEIVQGIAGEELETDDIEILAVIGHGGRSSDGGFFFSVSNDVGEFFTTESFARVVSGTRCLVLISCSAGGSDGDLISGRSVGLAANALRYGTATVVAPHWPISPRPGGRWLSRFLAAARDGVTVIEATHRANASLRNEVGQHPLDWLAMHCMGLGWITFDIADTDA